MKNIFLPASSIVSFPDALPVIPLRPMMFVESLAAQGMTISQGVEVLEEHILTFAGPEFLKLIKPMFND